MFILQQTNTHKEWTMLTKLRMQSLIKIRKEKMGYNLKLLEILQISYFSVIIYECLESRHSRQECLTWNFITTTGSFYVFDLQDDKI